MGINGGEMKNKESKAKKFARLYGAPILIPYIQWVLSESNRLGINRLFFVARDGFVLKQIDGAFSIAEIVIQ